MTKQYPSPPTQPGIQRRTALQFAASSLPLAGALAPGPAAHAIPVASVPLVPFLEPLPIVRELPVRLSTHTAFTPPPTVAPNRAINPATGIPFEGRGDAHQLRELAPPQRFFLQRFGAVPAASIHPQLPLQTVLWGANLGGANLAVDPPMTPMPTIVSRYQAGANTALLVRRFNHLPGGAPTGGFGRNEITMHTHNFHSAPDSDGGPCDPALGAASESPLLQGRFFFPGQYYDYYYNMKRAGFSSTAAPDGDVRETLGTLWYHDHREAHTSENVYKGLYGFHLAFNEYDTGSETSGFRLPSYPAYDVPIAIVDLKLDPGTGQAAIDLTNTDGHLGNMYLVNGKVQPYMNVYRRRYRLRLLNVGPSRFMQLHLTNPDNPAQSLPFWLIASDGNLLPRPLSKTAVRLAPANRADIIVDFVRLRAMGVTRVWLENRLLQDDPRGPSTTLLPAGQTANTVMELRIGAGITDLSVDPATIVSFNPITLPPLGTPALTRTLKFDRSNGQWTVNGRLMQCNEVRFTMQRNRVERWLLSTSGGWAHPVHMHFLEGRLVRRNGVPIPTDSQEYSRLDVLWLGNGEELEYIVRPQDYLGVYPMHCHNVVHEDHSMMLLLRVADVGDNLTEP